ncbi:hypothetical protein [Mycetocola spongiae]|uniref:hypothetical protein n=1 Tax=Mycetocola spongiae TaxID=2859226 RepID=UPI0021F417C5|nr:hypothetical protein [Mycetocola spongiae]
MISFARGYGQDPIYALFAAGYLTHGEINRAAPREFTLSDFNDLQLAQEIVRRLDSGEASPQLTEPVELDASSNVVPMRDDFNPDALPHAAYPDTEEPGYPDED